MLQSAKYFCCFVMKSALSTVDMHIIYDYFIPYSIKIWYIINQHKTKY
jgi:hypothetical protein